MCKKSTQEIGGYFFYEYCPYQHLGFRDHRGFEKYFDFYGPCKMITGWLLVPNKSQHKEREYQMASSLNAFNDIKGAVFETANNTPLGGTVHFHSHPAGSTEKLSMADIKFAFDHCEIYRNNASVSIVTSYPLRVRMVRLTRTDNPDKITIYTGEFLSWNTKKMKALL